MLMPCSAQYWAGRNGLLNNRVRHAAESVGLPEMNLDTAGDGKCFSLSIANSQF
jgi:hypothetical protein